MAGLLSDDVALTELGSFLNRQATKMSALTGFSQNGNHPCPLDNPRVGWALIFRPCLCVMAKRQRDVCALPESECSGAPDAASSSAHWLVFDNSPAIYGWVHGLEMSQVPSGTKENFCRP